MLWLGFVLAIPLVLWGLPKAPFFFDAHPPTTGSPGLSIRLRLWDNRRAPRRLKGGGAEWIQEVAVRLPRPL